MTEQHRRLLISINNISHPQKLNQYKMYLDIKIAFEIENKTVNKQIWCA